jgi:GDP-4-dehydro-6-deoxy-D-mannose reductase
VRALVTGGNGFVGRHLVARLREHGAEVTTAGRAADGTVDVAFDLADLASIRNAVEAAAPDVIFHLAGQAFVPAATKDPLGAYDTNVLGTARLYEVVRERAVKPAILYVSSAEVYGVRSVADYPLTEATVPKPATPYAASKLAAEAIALASSSTYGIRTIVTRAFNHIGPGQSESFVVPSFAAQLAEIAAGGEPRMFVGNLDAQRDFLDVRDVVDAYARLAERGTSGEVYNVASGTPVAIKEILRRLITIARVPVEVREDPARMRPSDLPLSYGSSAKLRAATGWQPRHSLDASLRDVYADAQARRRVAK